MFTVKKAWLIPIIMFVFIALVIGIMPGCGGKKGTTNSSNAPFFSPTDGEILRSAYTEYDKLKQTASPEEARKQLLNNLNAQSKAVKRAKLGIDGYTIFIDYQDGDFAAVDTFDGAESASQVKTTGFLPKNSLSDNIVAGSNNLINDSKAELVKVNYFPKGTGIGGFASRLSAAAIPTKTTASSKKVLILCPLNPDKDPTNTTVPYDCQKLLKEYGWTDSDITVKMNTKGDIPGILNVKLEDYRQIGNYGIILYFGHGAAEDNTNENNMFLQSCTMTKAALESNAEYRDWKNNKKLLVVNESTSNDGKTILYDLYIRADLLRQILGPLPGSYVQMATCWGWYFSKLFMDQGAAVFLGWDRKVGYTTADQNQVGMLSLMLGGTLSAGDAYLDKSVTQIEVSDQSPENLWDPKDYIYSTEADGTVVTDVRPGATPTSKYYYDLHFYVGSLADPDNYYLPAWINLKVPVLPAGTSRLKVDILDVAKNRYLTEDKPVTAGQTSLEIDNFGNNCFPPGPCSVAFYAFDNKGSTLLSNQAEFKLRPGANVLTMSSSKYKYTLSGSQDPKAGISFSRSGGMGLYIKLNGKALVNGEWSGALGFDAQPGDELEIMVIGSSGEIFSPGIFSASLGQLWLTSWVTGELVKITDGGDFKQYIGFDQTVVFDQKFVIPGAKPSPTSTPVTPTITSATPTTTTPVTTTQTSTTTTTPTTVTATPTTTLPTTQPTSTPLTHVDVWLTATNDSKATPVSSLKGGSITNLYIWAQGGNGQTGDFTLFGTLQQGTQMQLGGTKHATPGEVIYCGQWNGAFLNTVGTVDVKAISGNATVGSTAINITN